MKLLIISPQFPYPPNSGGKIRLYNIIKHLSERHDITLVAMIEDKKDANVEQIRKYCAQVYVIEIKLRSLPKGFIKKRFHQIYRLIAEPPRKIVVYSSDEIRKIVGELTKKFRFDIIQFESISMAQYHLIANGSKKILSLYDIESVKMKRLFQNSPFPSKLMFGIESFKYFLYEHHVCHLFDACLTMSETDEHYLRKSSTATRIFVSPNGVDIEYFLPFTNYNDDTKHMVFTGTMSYLPNHDGILYFFKNIFPLIRTEEKQTHLYIVGANPQKELLDLSSDPHVTVTGIVEDVRPYIASASVYIVPLRIGSGTRLKILEAMAMGKAVVSTSVGCEGIDVTHEKNIIIADEPLDFARWCIELLRNPFLRQKLGQEGRRLVETKYSWRSICASLEAVYLS